MYIGRSELCVETTKHEHCKREICPACWDSAFIFLSLLQLLCEEWASYGVFYKYQPIDLVRWEPPLRAHYCTAAMPASALQCLGPVEPPHNAPKDRQLCMFASVCQAGVPHIHLQPARWKPGELGWAGRRFVWGFSAFCVFHSLLLRAETLWSTCVTENEGLW